MDDAHFLGEGEEEKALDRGRARHSPLSLSPRRLIQHSRRRSTCTVLALGEVAHAAPSPGRAGAGIKSENFSGGGNGDGQFGVRMAGMPGQSPESLEAAAHRRRMLEQAMMADCKEFFRNFSAIIEN